MNVLILSRACCYPGAAVFDEQAKKVIELINETGVEAETRVIPGATAIYSGAVPKTIMTDLMNRLSGNEPGPAVLINGEIISYGMPKLDEMKMALVKYAEINNNQEEKTNVQ